MPKGQAVDLELEGADEIFAMLVEFGDEQYPDPRFQGPPPDGSTTDVTGPVHNEIAPPDRSIDNSTLGQPDYDRDGIGDAPTDMGAWERLMLGWREPQGSQGPFHELVQHGERATLQLGTNVPVSKKPSALVVQLPPHQRDLGPVDSGDFMF